MIRIVLGSLSPIKIEALKAAILALDLEADVSGLAALSGVSAQPIGSQETYNGALGRALAANDLVPEAYAIGIESGLFCDGPGHQDRAYVVVLTPRIRLAEALSAGVPVPAAVAEAAKRSGGRKTLGQIEAERSGCDPADPHRVWSDGRTDRKTLLADAVREALSQAIRIEQGVR